MFKRLFVFSLVVLALSFADGGLSQEQPEPSPTPVKINNPQNNGFAVTYDTQTEITSPDGKKFVLFKPLPRATIIPKPACPLDCSWSGDGLVAVFFSEPRVTFVEVLDTKTGKTFTEVHSPGNYPDWYDTVYSTRDKPDGEWQGDNLKILSEVTLRDGTKRSMQKTLRVDRKNGTFTSIVGAP